jgi:hypothetical protein
MPTAKKCDQNVPLVRPVKAAANVASAGVKAAVNEASGLSAVRAKSTMPARLKRPWAATRQRTPTPHQRPLAQLKTVNAANAARVTVTAVTAANVRVKHARTQPLIKPLVMTPPSQPARALKPRLMTALLHALISSVPSKQPPPQHPPNLQQPPKPSRKRHRWMHSKRLPQQML